MKRVLIDLMGQKFGRLIVVGRAENSKKGNARWKCICDCGGSTISYGDSLRKGNAKSCGCIQREWALSGKSNLKHGNAKSPKRRTSEYRAWDGMKSRCTNENNKDFDKYGGRGIRVCDRWMESFSNFIEDVGYAPGKKYSIDRIDVNGNYEPGNCRWATNKQQSRNRRKNRIVDFNGNKILLIELCELHSRRYELVSSRLSRGWELDKALNTPPRDMGSIYNEARLRKQSL